MNVVRRLCPLGIVAILAASPLAVAAETIERVVTATPDGVVHLEFATSGDVRIIGWERNEVRLAGTVSGSADSIEVASSGARVSIEGPPPEDHRGGGGDVDLEVRVPLRSRIEGETLAASFTIEGVRGAIALETISGSISIRGPVRIIEAASVSADVQIQSDEPLERVSLETVSGGIELSGALAPNARVEAESVSGTIEVRVPSASSATFSVETFSGSLKNGFGQAPKRSSKHLPAQEIEFQIGSGSAQVSLQSFSGGVDIGPR